MRWLRAGLRTLLRCWYRSGRKCGWHFRIVEKYGARLGETAPLTARLPNGAHVFCDLREQIPRIIYFEGVYERSEAYVFQRLLQPGWTVIDAGANLGQYTLLAASAVGPHGSVHSFEPVPSTAGLLRQNVAANGFGRIHLVEAALWHEAATLRLGLEEQNAFTSGGFSVGARGGTRPLAREVSAPAVVFDEYAAAHGLERVDLIKMDIEGAEYFALQGMRRVLHRDHPLILMEVCRAYAERLDYRLSDVWKLLAGELGYRAVLVGEDASGCVPLNGLDTIEQRNVLFHVGPLPSEVLTGWTRRDLLCWSRAGWAGAGHACATETSAGASTRHNSAGSNSTR